MPALRTPPSILLCRYRVTRHFALFSSCNLITCRIDDLNFHGVMSVQPLVGLEACHFTGTSVFAEICDFWGRPAQMASSICIATLYRCVTFMLHMVLLISDKTKCVTHVFTSNFDNGHLCHRCSFPMCFYVSQSDVVLLDPSRTSWKRRFASGNIRVIISFFFLSHYSVAFFSFSISRSLNVLHTMPTVRKSKARAKRSYVFFVVCTYLATSSFVYQSIGVVGPFCRDRRQLYVSLYFPVSAYVVLIVTCRNRKRTAPESNNLDSEPFVGLLFTYIFTRKSHLLV